MNSNLRHERSAQRIGEEKPFATPHASRTNQPMASYTNIIMDVPLWLWLCFCWLAAACAAPSGPGPAPPLATVERLDLARYSGTWYEIAAFPTWFQKGCTASQATYTPREDGKLAVENRCRRAPEGKIDSARGIAWVPDPAEPGKLKVRFFWPFAADYWVIDLDPDYRFAVVGHPSRGYLWILSREPFMEEATYRAILTRLERQHYDTTRLLRTVQNR